MRVSPRDTRWWIVREPCDLYPQDREVFEASHAFQQLSTKIVGIFYVGLANESVTTRVTLPDLALLAESIKSSSTSKYTTKKEFQ